MEQKADLQTETKPINETWGTFVKLSQRNVPGSQKHSALLNWKRKKHARPETESVAYPGRNVCFEDVAWFRGGT